MCKAFSCSVNTDFLNSVLGFTQACRVAQPQNNVADKNNVLNNIPRSARNVGNNALLTTRKQIHKRAFANVRLACDYRIYSLLYRLPAVIACKELFESRNGIFARVGNHIVSDLGNILLGVVRPGRKVRNKRKQIILNTVNLFAQSTVLDKKSGSGGRFAFCAD